MQKNSDLSRCSLLIGLACAALAMLIAGCDRIGLNRVEARSAPPKGMKVCFQCDGSDKTVCLTPGCKDGFVDCPGPCLKLSRGIWEHMHVEAHPDTDLWQRFHQVDGTSMSWNQNHVGDVIEMRAGMAVNIGKCTVCAGRGKVKCAVCDGTGRVACPICEGKGFVPETWTAFSNPKQKNPPNLIQLKDGRKIYAKIETRIGSRVYIRTESGKQEELLADDIVSTGSAQKR
jgi:Archaea-specific RecJ-like exonuclease, contains DnaJ-type Zn finger domain